jgi:NAD(P)-dependent dehydrogenase (short-subunit alcohol dehydrogenase family)
MDFKGKVALITGGGNGIGKAASMSFAGRGAKVVVVDRDGAAAEAVAGAIRQQGGDARASTADVTKSADVQAYVKAALDAYGRIDCFFNNAGIEGKVAHTVDYDEAVFDQVLAVNVKGVFLGLRHVLPVMLKQKSGAVVNTASVAGLVATPGMPAYVASKHAVIGLTKTASGEVAPMGVRVNAVCPGPVDTRMVHDIAKQLRPNDPASVAAAYRTVIPTGRYTTPQEIADVVLFLCSDLATNITGAQWVVDGGRTAVGGAMTQAMRD